MHDSNLDAAIAHANDATLAASANPDAWWALASLLAKAQRPEQEARVWEVALAKFPQNARLHFGAGLCDGRAGQDERAEQRLLRSAELDPQTAAPWLALARAAEGKGDHARAVDCFAEAARRDVAHASELFRIARTLLAQGHRVPASDALRRASEVNGEAAAFWGELATRLAGDGRLVQAGAALERALELAPDRAELYGLAGDLLSAMGRLEASLAAYTTGLRCDPQSPALLNKYGCAQVALGNLPDAEISFRRALSGAPAFMLARTNLVTVHIDNGKLATARAELRQALALPELAGEDRRELAFRLAVLEEHDSLAPAIAAAVEQEDDAPILAVTSQVDDRVLGYDDVTSSILRDLVGRIHERAGDDNRFPRASAEWQGWPAFEAHFALHMGDHPAKILKTRKWLANQDQLPPDPAIVAQIADARQYARGVTLRRTLAPAGVHGFAQESRLRFWHALLAWKHPELFPGQVKPTSNRVESNPLVPRTPPAAVVGTWRRFFSAVYLRSPPGPWRAALLYFALVEIHGFANGNGRVARFVVNLELEQRGYAPLVFSDEVSKSWAATLTAVRVFRDLEPLVDFFALAATTTTTLRRAVEQTADA